MIEELQHVSGREGAFLAQGVIRIAELYQFLIALRESRLTRQRFGRLDEGQDFESVETTRGIAFTGFAKILRVPAAPTRRETVQVNQLPPAIHQVSGHA